jgi:hypothetical protein
VRQRSAGHAASLRYLRRLDKAAVLKDVGVILFASGLHSYSGLD